MPSYQLDRGQHYYSRQAELLDMAVQAEVLIIGAGMAGATAALRLAQRGVKTVVFEAQGRIGGRVQTVKLADGSDIDFGASYVHGYQRGSENPTRRLAEGLGITLRVPEPTPGYVFGSDGKPLEGARVSKIQERIQSIMAEKEAEKDDHSLGKRVLEELRSVDPEAEPLARLAELGAGITFEDISARYWKTERGFAGVDAMPDGGYVAIIEAALKASGADVRLNEEVVAVTDRDQKVTLTTKNGQTFEAPYALSTIPVAVLQTGRVKFDPELPQQRTSLINRTSVGLLDKFALVYDKPWWPATAANFVLLPAAEPKTGSAGSVGEILSKASVMVANMHALSHQKPTVLLVYLATGAAARLEQISDEDLTPAVHEYVQSRLQHVATEAPTQPIQGKMVRWKEDGFALGATTSPTALGKDAQPDDLDLLGQSLWDGRLGFAGEGTDRHLRGSIVGAVASGEREAKRLCTLLGK